MASTIQQQPPVLQQPTFKPISLEEIARADTEFGTDQKKAKVTTNTTTSPPTDDDGPVSFSAEEQDALNDMFFRRR